MFKISSRGENMTFLSSCLSPLNSASIKCCNHHQYTQPSFHSKKLCTASISQLTVPKLSDASPPCLPCDSQHFIDAWTRPFSVNHLRARGTLWRGTEINSNEFKQSRPSGPSWHGPGACGPRGHGRDSATSHCPGRSPWDGDGDRDSDRDVHGDGAGDRDGERDGGRDGDEIGTRMGTGLDWGRERDRGGDGDRNRDVHGDGD